MKSMFTFLTVVFLSLALIACSSSPDAQGQSQDGMANNSPRSQVALEVSTITCTGCWPRVEASARGVPGVVDVKFDKQIIQKVVVTYDPALTTPDAIVEAIEKRGDKVTKVSEL